MASGSSSSVNEGVTNFLKLQNLFGASTSKIYRSHFVSLWNHYFGASFGEWQNTKDFMEKEFIYGGIGKEIYDSCDEHQKRILIAGNISLWDLSLLLDVIKKMQNGVKNLTSGDGDGGGMKFLTQAKLDETKILWEEVDYQSRIIVDYENYGNWMTKVVKALEENGMSKEKIFTTAFFLEKPAEDTPELDAAGKLADKLKQDGNLAFGKKGFQEALKFYTDAIEMDGLPDELLGTLYSNRSLCNIHLNKLEDAKLDAKCVMTLRPSWFKGYLRLGRVWEEMDEFNASSQFYMLAEVLQPGNKEVAAATKACKFKRDTQQFKSYNTGLQNILNMEKQMVYQNPQRIQRDKELVRQEDPFMLTREGLLYEGGIWGYPQDYKRAAEYFSKAASKGHATGIFNLARLTEEGNGVPKDVPKAFEMYKQVAFMAVLDDDSVGADGQIGPISSAQARLGRFYHLGEIVHRDLEVAISWFNKALENGSDLSPMYLGFIYLSEEKWNVPLAIWHFTMASYMGNVDSMEELAKIYLHMGDPILAQEWWKLAVHCGSVDMKQQEHLFRKEELTSDFNPCEFREEIKEDLKSSVEFKDVMKKFESPKYSFVWGIWNAAFHKVDPIPEEAERELCKAMKNI